MVPLPVAPVLQTAHGAAYQVKPKAARGPVGEGRRQVGHSRGGGIELLAPVGELGLDETLQPVEADPNGIFHPFASAVPQGIGEQFFQSQVQIELDFASQRVLLAEPGNLIGKTLEFVQVAVDCEFELPQNRRLWHTGAVSFNVGGRRAVRPVKVCYI